MLSNSFGARLRDVAAFTAKNLAGVRPEADRLAQAEAAMAQARTAIDGADRATRALLDAIEQQVFPALDEMVATAAAMASDRRLSPSVRKRLGKMQSASQSARAVLEGVVGSPAADPIACEADPQMVADEPGAEPEQAAEPVRPAPAFAAASALQGMRPLRVLVAEANGVHQLMLRTLLAQVGIAPEFVADGAAAAEAWQREPWDLILMDVQASGIDGPTTARMIRSAETLTGWGVTPIVALTGNPTAQETAGYAACGIDGWVAKPILGQSLFAAIEAALAAPAAAQLAEVA